MNPYDSLYQLLYGNNQPSLPPTPPPRPQQPYVNPLSVLFPTQPQQPQSVLGSLKIAQPRPIRIVKPKVFVSFDYENDAHYKRLLEAWSANTKFQFTWHDRTPDEIQTNAVDRVKAVLTTKIQEATHVLVLVGKYANQVHPDVWKIGVTNWVHFECKQAIAYNKKLVAVLLEPNNLLPNNIVGARGVRVDSFNQADIITALSQ